MLSSSLKNTSKILFLLLLSISIYLFSIIDNDNIYPMLILSFSLCLYNLYCSRHYLNIALFWLFLLMFPWDYLLVKISNAPFFYVYKHEYMIDVLFSLCIFCSFMSTTSSSKEVNFHTGKNLEFFSSKSLFYIYIISALIITLSIQGNNIILSTKSYSTYQENLSNGNGLIEYVLMIFIACLFFKKNKKMKWIFFSLLSIYIIKMILLGFRVQAMVAIIIMSFLIINGKMKARYNLLLCFIGLFSTLLYGFIKEGVNISEQALSLELLLDTRYGYVQSHQQGVLSSSTVISSYPNDSIPYIFRWPAAFIISILPRSIIVDWLPFMYPSAYVRDFQYIPGGGLFTVQIKFLLGYLGLILFSAIIALILKKDFQKQSASIYTIFTTTLLCFFPRWVSYDFFNYGVRSCVIVLILVYIGVFLKKCGRAMSYRNE